MRWQVQEEEVSGFCSYRRDGRRRATSEEVTRSATREEKKECFLISALSGTIIDVEHKQGLTLKDG